MGRGHSLAYDHSGSGRWGRPLANVTVVDAAIFKVDRATRLHASFYSNTFLFSTLILTIHCYKVVVDPFFGSLKTKGHLSCSHRTSL